VTALQDRIASLIAAQGPLSIAQFMTLALLDRNHGYYATRDPFGAGGDFTTSPEISQMFGEMLGLWCVQTWHDQGKPESIRLVELGPGRGTLMADALRAMRVAPEFLAALDAVVLVEASPALQAIQKRVLAEAPVAVSWSDRFEPSDADGALFLLANEFFDALPIRQFVRTERGWCERMVTADAAGELSFALSPVPADALVPPDRSMAPLGGVYETAPAATALVEEIAREIARHGGGALIVDYGYDTPGFGETLQAVATHRFADVLADPGESDLSAHVDFRALASAAQGAGARAYGPLGQGAFLYDLGITARAGKLAQSDAKTIAAALDRLTSPDKMGTLFKALAIVSERAPKPPGF
jgi:NADH dehydrogenase [ubiquinone] 1 alpha subcomplex assembly factor 7